jgi:hypothetical protein
MSLPLLIALGLAAAILIALVRFTLPPRATLNVYMPIAFFGPLALLWLFLIAAHRHWSWAPFDDNSAVPHALAALTFLVLMITGLLRVSALPGGKLLIGLIVAVLWLVSWFVGTIFTACSMGDCL